MLHTLALFLTLYMAPASPPSGCEAFERIDGTSVRVCAGAVVALWQTSEGIETARRVGQ